MAPAPCGRPAHGPAVSCCRGPPPPGGRATCRRCSARRSSRRPVACAGGCPAAVVLLGWFPAAGACWSGSGYRPRCPGRTALTKARAGIPPVPEETAPPCCCCTCHSRAACRPGTASRCRRALRSCPPGCRSSWTSPRRCSAGLAQGGHALGVHLVARDHADGLGRFDQRCVGLGCR